jgi:rRNA maturation RNase YbeY
MSRSVTVVNAHRRYRIKKESVARFVRHVLDGEGRKNASVSVVLVDSRVGRRMNRRYLSHDHTPDVLTFPLEQDHNLEAEIYVNLDKVREQARRYRVTFTCELARMVIHGTLHLLGYDDRTERLSKEMKKREDRYVAYWFS